MNFCRIFLECFQHYLRDFSNFEHIYKNLPLIFEVEIYINDTPIFEVKIFRNAPPIFEVGTL